MGSRVSWSVVQSLRSTGRAGLSAARRWCTLVLIEPRPLAWTHSLLPLSSHGAPRREESLMQSLGHTSAPPPDPGQERGRKELDIWSCVCVRNGGSSKTRLCYANYLKPINKAFAFFKKKLQQWKYFFFLCYSFIIFSSVEPIWTIWILGVINRPDCKQNQQIGEETNHIWATNTGIVKQGWSESKVGENDTCYQPVAGNFTISACHCCKQSISDWALTWNAA